MYLLRLAQGKRYLWLGLLILALSLMLAACETPDSASVHAAGEQQASAESSGRDPAAEPAPKEDGSVEAEPASVEAASVRAADTRPEEGVAGDGDDDQDDDGIVDENQDNGDDDEEKDGYYCRNLEDEHPVGATLAERYEVDYEQVMGWFCEDRLGMGEIGLALETAKKADLTVEEIVSRRLDGEGWGEIWRDLGLIGRPEDAGPPETPPGQQEDREHPGRGNDGQPPGQNKDEGDPGRGNDGQPPGQNKDEGNPGRGNDGQPPGQNKEKDNRGGKKGGR
jgi:hypothetical protein